MQIELDKRCSRCGHYKPLADYYKSKRDGLASWCKSCCSEHYHLLKAKGYFKEYYQRPNVKSKRASVIRKYRKQPHTQPPLQAGRTSHRLVTMGVIEKQPCVVCDNPNAEMHHPNYNDGGIVIFLCREHHRELHKRERINA